jgi:hypothetical protein
MFDPNRSALRSGDSETGTNTTGENKMPKILGITDDRTDCDCCGKSGLKRTVALDFDGMVRFFGVDCAGMAVHGRKTRTNANRVVMAADAQMRHDAATAKSKLARVSSDASKALLNYIGTGRNMDQRARYTRDDDQVIVDVSDAADVAFFVAQGFKFDRKFDF